MHPSQFLGSSIAPDFLSLPGKNKQFEGFAWKKSAATPIGTASGTGLLKNSASVFLLEKQRRSAYWSIAWDASESAEPPPRAHKKDWTSRCPVARRQECALNMQADSRPLSVSCALMAQLRVQIPSRRTCLLSRANVRAPAAVSCRNTEPLFTIRQTPWIVPHLLRIGLILGSCHATRVSQTSTLLSCEPAFWQQKNGSKRRMVGPKRRN